MLRRYVTSVYYKPDEFPYSLVKYLPRQVREPVTALLSNRRHPSLEDARVRSIPYIELGNRLVSELPVLSRAVGPLALNSAKNYLFDNYVARFSLEPHDILYACQSVALQQFRVATGVGSILVLESTHVHPRYHQRVLLEEAELAGIPTVESGPLWDRAVAIQIEELDRADHVIALSEFSRQTLVSEGVSANKVVAIPAGVSTAHFYPTVDKKGASDGHFRILFVGTIGLRKGVRYLLEAFKQLALPDAELWLRGSVDPGMERILAHYDGTFHMLPPVPRERLVDYFNAADVFVLPSLLESFGLVVYQALACGVPVITTTSCGAEIEDGKEGFVVDPRDVEALQAALLRLYSDRALRLRMGEQALNKAESCGWDVFGSRAVAFFQQIWNERSSTRRQ